MQNAALRVVAAASALALASGCVSTTLIKSQPPGAKVYLDGAYVGVTPYEMSDTKIVGSITHVTLRADGFQDSNVLISRNEKFDAGACLGGVLVLFPFLWIQGYNPERTYEMTPLYPPGYGYPGHPQGYPQYQYPPPGQYPYPPQGYPPTGAYPQQPQAYPPPGATPPPPQGAPGQPPAQGAPPAQVAPPPPPAAPQPPPAPAPQNGTPPQPR